MLQSSRPHNNQGLLTKTSIIFNVYTLIVDQIYWSKILFIANFSTDQHGLAKVPNFLKITNEKTWLKTLGTSIIYCPMSHPSPYFTCLTYNNPWLCVYKLKFDEAETNKFIENYPRTECNQIRIIVSNLHSVQREKG